MQQQGPVTFDYDFDKVLAALVYFASKPDRVINFDRNKALSLLFLADKAHLLRYGEPIFGDYYRALPHGVVPQRTLQRLNKMAEGRANGQDIERLTEAFRVQKVKGHGYPILIPRIAPDLDALSELEIQILDEVVALYGGKSFDELKGLVHPPAWYKAWASKPRDSRVAPLSYEDLFEGDSQDVKVARARMIEDFALRRACSPHGVRRSTLL